MQSTLKLTTAGPAETEALGERLGSLLCGGELVCLFGQLGAGKTVFVRGVARAMGCPPDEVSSPTYVLERVYRGEHLLLRHLDAYRLSGADEFEETDLGSPDLPANVVSALEWADRVSEALPAERLDVRIEVSADGRRCIEIMGHGDRGETVLAGLAAG